MDSIGFVWCIKQHAGYETWDAMFSKLEQYKAEHNDTWIRNPETDEEKKLWSWTSIQRQKRRADELTEERIQKLDSLDFDWNLDYSQKTWEEMFSELEEFQKAHGHCLVPTAHSTLGGWVSRQRMLRRGEREGWRPITQEQIARLGALGFVWDAQDYDAQWNEMYSKLVAYYEEHGHCRVPTRSGKLGKWVKRQRQTKDKASGSNVQLTQEKIDRLNAIDFAWKADENIESWDVMHEKLRAYKEANGDCLVPQSEGKLGRWVDFQRMRRKRAVGRLQKLTTEQVKMLDKLGFAWSKEEGNSKYGNRTFESLKHFLKSMGIAMFQGGKKGILN